MAGHRLIDEVGSSLVDREAVLGAVQELVDAVATGRPAVLVVDGPAGIGKTSVLRAASELARRSGLKVLSARGTELEHPVGYGVLRSLLATDVPVPAGGPLAAALSASPVAPAPDPDGAHASHVAVAGAVRALAEPQPVLLVVDDAQWADRASLLALVAAAARLQDAPVGLLLACRSAPAGTPAGPLTHLMAAPGTVVQSLAPLSAAGTEAVLGTVLDAAAVARLAGACHAACGGVPFYLAELRHELTALAVPSPAAVRELRPAAVRRSVTLRVGAEGEQAVAVARALAVLGAGAALRLVAALAGVPLARAGEICDALIANDVLAADAAGPAFAHPIIAAAVLADVPVARRGELHAQAAALLRADGAPVVRIAAHLLQAAPSADPAVAGELAAAGHDALARAATGEAIALLRRALEEPPPAPARAGVLLALGTAELLSGDPASVGRLEQARAAATDPAELLMTTAALVTATSVVGDFEAGLRAVSEAEAAGLPGPLARRLDGHVAVAACSTVTGAQTARAAIARLRAAEDPGPVGRSAVLLHDVVRGAVTAPEGAVAARAALHQAERETGPDAIMARYPALYALILAGEDAAAGGAIDALDRVAEASASRTQAAMVAATRAQHAGHRGDVHAVLGHARAAIALGDEVGFGVGVLVGTAWLALAQLEQGDREAGRATLARSFDGPLAATGAHLYVRFARACLLEADGHHRAALVEALQVGEGMEAWGWPVPVEFPWRGVAARAASALGETARAVALAGEEVEGARRAGIKRTLGLALLTRAAVAARPQDVAEARELLRESGAMLVRARAALEAGRLHIAAGEEAAGREALREALDVAASLGATALAAEARRLLVARGVRPRRAATSGVDALTGRERQVAELAAAGRSNRQIAEAEICSVKTVEVHLTNAYRKLGIDGRSGLAKALDGT